jgi:hypothetical protein
MKLNQNFGKKVLKNSKNFNKKAGVRKALYKAKA